MALYFTGGLLKHINSLLAFCAPLTNSYRRLVPGYEAPVVVAYSARNRSAACRIPMYSQSPNSKRIEFRCPDPGAEPIPGLRGDGDGRHGRYQESDRSWRPG